MAGVVDGGTARLGLQRPDLLDTLGSWRVPLRRRPEPAAA